MDEDMLVCDVCGAEFEEWYSPIKGAGFESTCWDCFMDAAYEQFVAMGEELKRSREQGLPK